MELTEGTPITLEESEFIVTQKNGIDLSCKYVRNAEVRKAVEKLVTSIAERYGKELFSDICGQCGTCCGDFEVRLTASDIQIMAFHLGYTDTQQFRNDYVKPAFTWNAADGILKKEGRSCVFLKKGSTFMHHCSIYNARPSFCATLPASLDVCKKDRGMVVDQFSSVLLDREALVVTLKSEKVFTITPLEEEAARLAEEVWQAVARIPEECDNPDLEIVYGARDDMDKLMHHYFTEGATAGVVEELERITRSIQGSDLANGHCKNMVESIRGKAGLLRELVDEDVKNSTEHAPQANDFDLGEIRFHRECAFVSVKKGGRDFKYLFLYSACSELLDQVRILIDEVLSASFLKENLWHQEPVCFLCGECCRRFRVEITFPEIIRLAEHFKLSEEETRSTYFHPPAFSWNERSGIMAKVDGARLDREASAAECIFLEKKSDKVYHCRIYEARPDVCSDFSPSNLPCRELSKSDPQRPLAANLIFIDLAGEKLYFTTQVTVQNNEPPVEIFIRQYPQLTSICSSLRNVLRELIISGDSMPVE